MKIIELVDNQICVLHTVLYLYTRSNNDKKLRDNSKSIENDFFKKKTIIIQHV